MAVWTVVGVSALGRTRTLHVIATNAFYAKLKARCRLPFHSLVAVFEGGYDNLVTEEERVNGGS